MSFYSFCGNEFISIPVLCRERMPFYVGSQIPVSSRMVEYVHNVILHCFLSQIHLSNRGGLTVLFCIKAATLQYLGRVVWSVQQEIPK